MSGSTGATRYYLAVDVGCLHCEEPSAFALFDTEAAALAHVAEMEKARADYDYMHSYWVEAIEARSARGAAVSRVHTIFAVFWTAVAVYSLAGLLLLLIFMPGPLSADGVGYALLLVAGVCSAFLAARSRRYARMKAEAS